MLLCLESTLEDHYWPRPGHLVPSSNTVRLNMQETGKEKKSISCNWNNSKQKIHSFSDFLGKKTGSTNEGETCLFVSVEGFHCRCSEFLHLSISTIFSHVLPLWHEESAWLHILISCLFPPKREAATFCLCVLQTPSPSLRTWYLFLLVVQCSKDFPWSKCASLSSLNS